MKKITKIKSLSLVILVLLMLPAWTTGQSQQGLTGTWKGPDLELVKSILNAKPRAGGVAAKPKGNVAKFAPVGDSGVSKTLAEAFGRTAQEVAHLKGAFDDIKAAYEAEVAKQGKSNNIAAALAFFIATNVMVYNDSPEPSEEATEAMFTKLQDMISASPNFVRVTNAEKQQMHDWLVCVAGFALTNYQQAKSSGDAKGLKTIRDFAGYATEIVLGTALDASATPSSAPAPTTSAAAARVVGVWSISASNHGGSNLVTNAGYTKGQYQFNANGTYAFKSERWFGYMRSREFYTTEESGTYSVNGNTLTISPKTSKTILRNPEGAVQKSQNNQLETVTYKWQLHYFEGINETQLVLQPPKETTRDGGFSQTSLFPNAYLYSQGSKLEWRF